ncbi:carboxylesterase [Rhyzopertha dominica]|nr:carboxylesterase [Rhyzopertha dominica]
MQIATTNGVVQGRRMHTQDRKVEYFAYKGIPYAQPPVKDLRFRAPQPPKNWSGVLNARNHGYKCFQVYLEPPYSEDCLYLNIYTLNVAEKKPTKLLPVMFWIFGGAYALGNGNDLVYGPDRFLEHGVNIVTINYRLGVFGSLSTGDRHSPGNYGLKDALAALHWTHKNIARFGGDPKKLTIFGESAGASIVEYLMLTPKANGLFQRAISESGSVLCSWTRNANPKRFAVMLADVTGLASNDSEAIVNHLRSLDALKLNLAATSISIDASHGTPYSPNLEPKHEGAIITRKSYELLRTGNFIKVPYIMGFNSEEGVIAQDLIDIGMPNVAKMEANPDTYIPRDLNIPIPSKDSREVLQRIRNFYFTGSQLSTENSVLQLISDDQFIRGIYESAKIHSRYAPTYLYQFSYAGFKLGKRALIIPTKRKFEGVGHAEEVWYMWSRLDLQDFDPDDLTIREKFLKMWTNFAKTGRNPTPVKDPALDNVIWPPINLRSNNGSVQYLDIDIKMAVKLNPHDKRMQFWDGIYKKYGRPPFDTY